MAEEKTNPSPKREEEHPPVRAIDLLYGVIFIGILLTFAIYVSVTMLLGSQTSLSERYLTGREYRMPLTAYNEAYYKNTTLQDLITRYDYGLFGKVDDKNVLVGRENFLFEVVRDDNNYNYLRDYLGEYAYEDESLESIYNFLKLRQTAYNNQGAEYIVAVIPNVQSVYGEYLPTYLQNGAGQTRLDQLTAYMRTKDDITVIDLSDALLAAKSAGVLYNNTEDSLNSLGHYFVYQALYNLLPEKYKTGASLIPYENVTLYTHYTPGKTLARNAGLSAIVKNETVSLSNTMEFNYLLQELYSGVEVTYAGHNSNGEPAGQTILLEFSNEWDKIQLMPYFSSTFDDVVYKIDHNFDLPAVETTQPTLVIQFIHEYEIGALTNSNVSQTYNDGLKAGENPFTTSSPIVTEQVWLDDHTVCLAGWAEAGSELTVSGDAAEIRTVQIDPDETLFFVLIEMADQDEMVVRLQAAVEDKNRSKVTKVTVTRGEEEHEPVTSVVIGDGSRLFATNPSNAVLPDTGTLSVLEAELSSFMKGVLDAGLFKKTEFINVVIPQSSSVYRDDAPEELDEVLQKTEEFRMAINELYRACGWTVIDLTENLRNQTDLGKLYGLTFDHWTDYGAYIGYRTLMSHIRNDFVSVKAMTLSDYTRVTQITQGGELSTMLGFSPAGVLETQVRLHVNQSEVRYLVNGNAEGDFSGAFTTTVGDDSLPIAIVLRDSAGTAMLESMAQHFRVMIVLPEGETEISAQMLMLFEPDYVIRLAEETSPGLYDMKNAD